ncbi:MAG: flagellar hook-associated protein FlgK, partial [Pseudomonadales bacterium]
MADLLEIGTSGLLASQAGIATAGHNIANANVEGYSRQEALYSSQIPQRGAGGYVGSGVITSDIRRISDSFLSNQLRSDTEQYSKFETYVGFVSQLEALLANESAGLASGMQGFFASLQAASDDPASITARQQILGEANNLQNRFNTLYNKIQSQTLSINEQITATVQQINGLAEGIAELNQKIVLAKGQAGGAEPNDLLDKRDILLNQLSELISVKTTTQDGDSISVFVGKGQTLVLGAQATRIQAISSDTRPGEIDLKVGVADISDALDGGSLGALIEIRQDVLAPTQNTLGQLAIGLADSVNQQQQLGTDLFDRLGLNLFSDINDSAATLARALPSRENHEDSTGIISVSIGNVSDLRGEDYELEFIGPTNQDFSLNLADTGERVASGSFGGTLPASVLTDLGFNLALEAGSFTVGDKVLIQPTRNGAREFSVQLERPEGLALGQPVRTSTVVHNTGTGSISPGSMIAVRTTDDTSLLPTFATAEEISPPLLVRFDTATTYSVFDNSNPNAPTDLVPPQRNLNFVPGTENELFSTNPLDPSFRGYQVSINGAPLAGDEFNISFNSSGVGDNRNALEMVDLQVSNLMNRGNNSLANLYSSLVQNVASKVGQATIDRDAASSLREQSQNALSSKTGVNLDEEAARLIQLEQAYNA